MNTARYLRRWKVGGAIAMILLCSSVLISQILTMLNGSKKLDWPLVGILVFGIAINVLGIFRAYALERQYPDGR